MRSPWRDQGTRLGDSRRWHPSGPHMPKTYRSSKCRLSSDFRRIRLVQKLAVHQHFEHRPDRLIR